MTQSARTPSRCATRASAGMLARRIWAPSSVAWIGASRRPSAAGGWPASGGAQDLRQVVGQLGEGSRQPACQHRLQPRDRRARARNRRAWRRRAAGGPAARGRSRRRPPGAGADRGRARASPTRGPTARRRDSWTRTRAGASHDVICASAGVASSGSGRRAPCDSRSFNHGRTNSASWLPGTTITSPALPSRAPSARRTGSATSIAWRGRRSGSSTTSPSSTRRSTPSSAASSASSASRRRRTSCPGGRRGAGRRRQGWSRGRDDGIPADL